MTVYELTHLFFRSDGEPVYSPKGLGLFASAESAEEAVRYYKMQPGFCDAPDAFSIRQRPVYGGVSGGVVFEALVYLHSADYEFEASAELGLFGTESDAESSVARYCTENAALVHARGIIAEEIVNRCPVGRRNWAEGFTVSG